MKNIKVTRTGPKSIRFLGRTGENKAETMSFDCHQFVEDYGEGTALLFFRRPGADYAYPVVCEQNGENVTWVVNAADTEFEGIGELEIQWHVDGVIAKSASYPVKIEESLPTGGEAPPEPIKPWFDKLSQQIADISGVTPEQIRGVLEAYLDEQPIPAGPPGEKGEKGDPIPYVEGMSVVKELFYSFDDGNIWECIKSGDKSSKTAEWFDIIE